MSGDFGEEDVPLVQSVAALPFPKAVILGNHDAWHTQKFPKCVLNPSLLYFLLELLVLLFDY